MPNIGINDFLPVNEGASGTVNPELKHFVLHQTLVNHSSEYLSSDAGFREISKLVKSDPAVLMRQDRHGNLPIHYLCCRCTDKRAFQLFHDVNSTCFSIKNKQSQLPIHLICSSSPRERECAQLILSAYPQGAHQLTDESSRRNATMDRRKKASTEKDKNKKLESQLGFLRKQNTELQRKVKLFERDVKEKEMQLKQMSDKKNTSELDVLRKKNKELEVVIEASQREKERDQKTLQGAPDENKRVRCEYDANRKKSRDEFAHRAETFQVVQKAQREVIEAGRKLDKVLIGMLDGHSADDNPPLLPIKAMKAFAESLHKRTELLEAQSDSQKPKQRSKTEIMFDMFMASPNLSRSSLAEFIHCSHQVLEETLEKNGRTLSTSTANNDDDLMSTDVSDETTEARSSKRARVSLETSDS